MGRRFIIVQCNKNFLNNLLRNFPVAGFSKSDREQIDDIIVIQLPEGGFVPFLPKMDKLFFSMVVKAFDIWQLDRSGNKVLYGTLIV